MDAQIIEAAALDSYPDYNGYGGEKYQEHQEVKREGFVDGARWAADNYPINWINPEVELPPVEKDNESVAVFVFYEYTGVKGKIYTEYGTAWCELDVVSVRWHIADGPLNQYKIIGWAPLTEPEWYNNPRE